MGVDENQFFREITLRICGSLEIEKALWHCFLYIRNILPADELILTVYDPDQGTLDVVATAYDGGGVSRTDKSGAGPPEETVGRPGQIPSGQDVGRCVSG